MPLKISRRALLVSSVGLAAFHPRLPFYQALANALSGAKPLSDPKDSVQLPPLALRGYGTLSAEFHRTSEANGAASVLRIRCETPQKAQLVQAKYLSDAGLLPGSEPLTLSTPHGKVAAHRVSAVGCVAACALGEEALLFAAADPKDLGALFTRHLPDRFSPDAFRPHAAIPMFLDRWDRYGLLAYYYPFTTPGGKNEDYDYIGDFDYCAAHGPLGLIAWDRETLNDTAEGLANTPLWDWVAAECRARELPLHINLQNGAALWLTNRYRDEMMQKAPQFCGTYYTLLEPNIGEQGFVSWNADVAENVELGILQQTVRRFAADPNLVGWMEPHTEADQPPLSLLVEYGPVADRSYRRFLQERYASPAALSTAWYGDINRVTSWLAVQAPELASFLGWGPDALDLSGDWRIRILASPDGHRYTADEARRFGREPTPTEMISPEWYQPQFDDQAWGTLWLPGNDRQMFLPHAPAVIRRSFEVPASWLTAHPRVWIALWDLTDIRTDTYPIYVNGRQAPDMPPTDRSHHGAVEVTALLRPGMNSFALRLPKGFIAYRLYLSPNPPDQYPSLGPNRNAQWADFADWVLWSRGQALRRGAEMIRQIDPDRQINFAAPHLNAAVTKRVCEDYGGHFHDTGSMAGFWNEYTSILMRGSGLPSSAEPGNGAHNLRDFHAFWGRWFTEGLQGVHYFQHLGDILWNPDIRKEFETNRTFYQMIGKYHVPFAEVAILYGISQAHATGWPWGFDPDTNLMGGYWAWNTGFILLNYCPRDGVTEQDFEAGNADKYRVIVDSNTSIMGQDLLARIEQWVRRGGTFITFAQTGRHTPTELNSWSISRLTGYSVTRIDRYGPGGQPQEAHRLQPAPDQTILHGEPWTTGVRGSGLSLKKTAPECRDLLLWEDGSVAAGVRELGMGRIFHLGAHFETIGDRRISPHTYALLTQILDTLKVEQVPGQADGVMMRHYIGNSGLHDVWVVFNDRDQPATTDLIFRPPLMPARCLDVKTGQETPMTDRDGSRGVRGLALEPFETRMFLTPRSGVELAPLEWLSLQRSWWRSPKTPPATPLPTPAEMEKNGIDLCDDWAFKPVDGMGPAEIVLLMLPVADDSRWDRVRLGVWSLPDRTRVKHAVLRKRFTVPENWTREGAKQLWVRSWSGPTFRDAGRVLLDGEQIQDFRSDGVIGRDVTDRLTPGSTHTLALEVKGAGSLCGIVGSAWIYHYPDPAERQDLRGDWVVTRDGVHDEGTTFLPGSIQAMFAHRSVRVDASQAHRNAVLYIATDGPMHGVLINGRMIARHHHYIGSDFALNLTPYINFGEENRFELICRSPDHAYAVHTVELRFYDPGVYP